MSKILMLTATLAAALMLQVRAAQAETPLLNADLAPKYAVGVVPNFVRDFNQTFDAWGKKYKSAAYQEFLKKTEAAGVPHTTFTQIYYPATQGKGRAESRARTTVPAALPAAASGRQMTPVDLFGGSRALVEFSMKGWEGNPYQAYVGAPMAEGRFPLVIMVHGLAGSVNTWASAAEYLAAQGYIVATVSLTSDSTASPFLEDPSSPWAGSLSDKEKRRIYKLRATEASSTVFRNFFKFMFGQDKQILTPADFPDPSKLVARKNGGALAGQSQADLFEQRVADVARVIAEMKYLNEKEATCRAALEREGFAKPLCGRFAGRIDVDRIGVLGHSLGSMTAQSAAAFYEDVDTAVGFNNGMPRMWEPWGGFPGDPSDGLPAGVSKPLLMVIGSDDDFIHMVFRRIHWQMFKAAGGDPRENYPLAAEQPWPTAENPQPVALSCYKRATAEKMFIIFRDENHGSATDDIGEHFKPGATIKGERVPLSPDAKPKSYEILGWIKEGGKDVYLPHLMRNYFVTNWFDWQLKDNEAARARLLKHPFARGVQAMRQSGVGQTR